MTCTPFTRARLARPFPVFCAAALAVALSAPTPADATDLPWVWTQADGVVYSDAGLCVHPYLNVGNGWLSTGFQTYRLSAMAYASVRLTDSCAPGAKPVTYGAHFVAMRIIYWYWDGSGWVLHENSDWFYYGESSEPVGELFIEPPPELVGMYWTVTFEAYVYRPPGLVRSGTRYFDGSPSWKGGYVAVGPFVM